MNENRWSKSDIIERISKEDIIEEIEYFLENKYEENIECKKGETRFFNISNIEKFKDVELPTKYLICRALRKTIDENDLKSNKFNPDTAISVLNELFGKSNIREIKLDNAKYMAIIPNNPKRNDARLDLERDGFYNGWGGGLSCVLVEGQHIILYISGDIQKYQYICRVTKINKVSKTFDFELITKFSDELSSKFSRNILLELGLAPTGVIRYCLDKYPKICRYVSDILMQNNIIDEELWCDENSNDRTKKLIKKEKDMSSGVEKLPLNQILYGPPGTGKTYNTINKALEIIFSAGNMDRSRKYDISRNNKETDESISYSEAIHNKDREALKSIYDYFSERGQIDFVTFHQSYGYEEFIEGIKPCDLNDDCDENIRNIKYTISKGIFNKLSTVSKENYKLSKNIEKKIVNYNYEELFEDFAKDISRQLKDNNIVKLNEKDALITKVNYYKDGDFQSFTLGGSVTSAQRLTIGIIRRDFESYKNKTLENWHDVKSTRTSVKPWHGNAAYYFSLYQKIAEYEEENPEKYIIKNNEGLKNYILITQLSHINPSSFCV